MLSWHSTGGTEENHKNLFRIAGVTPGIQTRDLTNMNGFRRSGFHLDRLPSRLGFLPASSYKSKSEKRWYLEVNTSQICEDRDYFETIYIPILFCGATAQIGSRPPCFLFSKSHADTPGRTLPNE